jgi:FkbM family methyltransferase
MIEPFGARAPGWLARAVIATTSSLPDNWLGLRLAIGLRRIVTMQLADDGGLDVVRWGLRMRLHPRRNGCEKNALFTPQMYEAAERAELAAQIEKAKAASRTFVFIDVGANVGLFSLFVASCAGARAKIVAIEPEPQNLQRLQFNIAANSPLAIRVVPVALGEKQGLVALDIDGRDRGGTRTRALTDQEAGKLGVESHGLPEHDLEKREPVFGKRSCSNKEREQDDDVKKDHPAVVQCCTLLELLRQEGISYVDALKIDVEGAEDKVLDPFFRDAPEELWPDLIIIEDARNSWRSDLFSVFAKCGYTIAMRTKLNVAMHRVRM